MKIARNNETENEVEYVEKTDDNVSKKSNKRKVLIFLACLVFSFVVWCYASYLDDPIIKKDISIVIFDEDFTGEITFKVYNSDGKEISKIEIYGEESNLDHAGTYEIRLKPSDFPEGSDTYNHVITLSDGIHSHVKTIKIVKIEKNNE